MTEAESLPPFSGTCPPCVKCGLPKGKAVGSTTRYVLDGELEYVERRCGHCGYSWNERCADADWVQCYRCQGCAWPPILNGKPECEECQRNTYYLRGPSIEGDN